MLSIWSCPKICCLVKGLPFPKQQILDSKMKEFFKRVENNVGKGEIASYEHFLLFPQCFQKCHSADT